MWRNKTFKMFGNAWWGMKRGQSSISIKFVSFNSLKISFYYIFIDSWYFIFMQIYVEVSSVTHHVLGYWWFSWPRPTLCISQKLSSWTPHSPMLCKCFKVWQWNWTQNSCCLGYDLEEELDAWNSQRRRQYQELSLQPYQETVLRISHYSLEPEYK